MKKLVCFMLAAVLSCSVFFTGCTSANVEGSQSAQGETDTKTEAEAEVPTIVRTSISSEPDSLDPWQSAATDTEAIFHNVFEGLFVYNEKGELEPGLAESYDVSEDGLTYTFHLRDNVTFHNGEPMTSADVLYTYENLAGMNGEKAASSKFDSVESINAVDDYTFEIKLTEPSASFLASNIVAVLPEGYTEQSQHPIGTGPYKFKEYIPGQKVVLELNEDYYEESRKGTIQTVEVYIMTDASSVVTALRSGQLDFASVSVDNANVLAEDFDIYNSAQNMVQIFALNNSIEPLNDVRVRQAINYAIDKDAVIEGVFDGYATKLYSNFSPVMAVYYNDQLEDTYPTDIEKAKELLKEAGYENGFDLTITVPANYTSHVDTALIFADQLAQVGINVQVETIEWATWLEDVYSNAQYESTIIGLTGKLDPDSVLGRFETTYSKNFFKFSDARYDELIQAARVELDETKRADMYKECQQILNEQAAAVFVCDPNLTVACRKDLKGYTFYPVGFIDFSKLSYEAQ